LNDLHVLALARSPPDGISIDAPTRASLAQEGQPMGAITIMSPTPRFILYLVALILFFLAGIGFRPLGDRVSLIGLGLAAAVFPFMWDSLAGV
jgi:hypothetical protein